MLVPRLTRAQGSPEQASVRVIGSPLGAEEIPAVVPIPLSRRRIRRLASFFSFRPISSPVYSRRQPRLVADRHPFPKVERENSPFVASFLTAWRTAGHSGFAFAAPRITVLS